MKTLFAAFLVAQSLSANTFQDPEAQSSPGLQWFSDALRSPLRWTDESQTQFASQRWVGGKVRLASGSMDLVRYATGALEGSLTRACAQLGGGLEARYEGAIVGTFSIDCEGFVTVFAYRIDGLGTDLYYFNRDGRTMATADHDLRHAPRQIFVVLDAHFSFLGPENYIPLLVDEREIEFN